jgi:hypothetical protein
VGEVNVAAPFEVYASSFAAGTVPIAAEPTVTTRHRLRLVATPPNADGLHVDRQLLGWAADRDL